MSDAPFETLFRQRTGGYERTYVGPQIVILVLSQANR